MQSEIIPQCHSESRLAVGTKNLNVKILRPATGGAQDDKIGFLLLYLSVVIFLAGCAPTFPKEKIAQAVVDICRREHNISDIKAKVVGKTLGVRIALEDKLFDADFRPVSEAYKIISDVALAATRVCLSSDADIKFCVVIVADKRSSGFEWRLLRYIMDIKRVYLEDISRGEFFKRADFDMRFNPQALLKGAQGDFYLEDIKLTDFLSKQIAKRIKNSLGANAAFLEEFNVASIDGRFEAVGGIGKSPQVFGTFKITIDAAPKIPSSGGTLALDAKARAYLVDLTFGAASDTMRWYGFEDFNLVQLKFGKFGEFIIMDKKSLFKNYGKRRKKPEFSP